MSRENLTQKIYAHLTAANQTPLAKLQGGLLKLKDNRLAEVITLKVESGTVNRTELISALQLKGLQLKDVTDSEGYVLIKKLAEYNILMS